MSYAVSEWGPEGARRFDENASVIVVVDVLSFSTCIDIAVSRGATVFPFSFHDHDAARKSAIELGAELAGPRGSADYRYSLSPASMTSIAPNTKLVLPSPNGSTISKTARSVPVLTGCLRNARAVAGRAIEIANGKPIAVVPAGERWPDGSLRPAIEDLIGAGAILDELGLPCSPEAEIARQAFRSSRSNLVEVLRGCVSGQELIGRGFPQDVDLAVELNASTTAPQLIEGAYSG